MPGFLGGGSSGASTGVGGEIKFPKEFIDPVTKLRVSNPQNLIDTDFEYGLQPTKWETVELINNTPSFFSKSGDTTIPNITSITTNAGTREVIVETALAHNLDVGIPINVQGTKSVTADGAYIINSIPNPTTFTYLARDIQPESSTIADLYSSIITGEFFQGSQLRLAQSAGIVTDGASISTLTVNTESTHGFGVNTPFYFLNLNSTISQEFAAANTETKSFDSSNSATAQTFDGSNTLSSINIDWSNSATVSGINSTVSEAFPTTDTIEITHGGVENFVGLKIGQPLYHDVQSPSGYFLVNPRGVVFLADDSNLGTSVSVIQVSEVPGGPVIDILANMQGIFQIANQARLFAGNNVDEDSQELIDVVLDPAINFDGANDTGISLTVSGYSGGGIVTADAIPGEGPLPWHQGAMVIYETTGAPASGLSQNTTYFVDTFFQQGTSDTYSFTLVDLPGPNGNAISAISGGSGTQTFRRIDVSPDRDIFHIYNAGAGHGYQEREMLKYNYPVDGNFSTLDAGEELNFYFVEQVYDTYNFSLTNTLGELIPPTQVRVGEVAGTAITPTEVTAIGFAPPITFSVTSGTLPDGLTLNTSTGVVSGTPTAETPFREVIITAVDSTGSTDTQLHEYQVDPPPFVPGQAQFTSPGTFTWTAPYNMTVSIVAVGGGGGGGGNNGRSGPGSAGGGGGGLRWLNDYPVTQGRGYTVRVGNGGNRGNTNGDGGPGGDSYFRDGNTTVVQANGGNGGRDNVTSGGQGSGGSGSTLGGYTSGGGNGGTGGAAQNNGAGAGGGGAAGYSGNGGQGQGTNGGPNSGSGGGAGGGRAINSRPANADSNGGGVGIFGQGANGSTNVNSRAGSGGGNPTNTRGGNFGGGGGGTEDDTNAQGQGGGSGAVRIIWPGTNRFFPDTGTANV